MAGSYYRLDKLALTTKFNLKGLEELELAQNEDTLLSNLYANTGRIYYNRALYDSSLIFYFKSLDLHKKAKIFNTKYGYLLHYIGSVYKRQGDMDKACEWYSKQLDFGISSGFTKVEAEANYLLASCAETIEEERKYELRALRLYEQMNHKRNIALMHGNISNTYDDIDSSIYHKEYAIRIYRELEDNGALASQLAGAADLYVKKKEFVKAEMMLKEAEELLVGTDTKRYLRLRDLYESYSYLYENKGESAKALKYNKLYYSYRDSARQEEYRNRIIELDVKYETAQKEAQISQQKAAIELEKAENEKQKTFKYALIIGLLVVTAFGAFIFNRLKITRRQNAIIESQKETVENQRDVLEVKNKEITDSINYAKRIQAAILPPDKIIKESLEHSFIIYKPKDIVAGDFYWMEQKEGWVMFAAADCTGHGVPGAMVSVICNSGLNRSVREFGLTDPGKILDKTREIVIEEFQKSEEEVSDGMDIALCCLKGNQLMYAGAHNPLWVIRNKEIIEIKADKQPIGKFDHIQPYTTHSFELEKGDTIYIFTDGYVDQFGGEKGKKFKTNSFRELLLSISDKTMNQQKQIINDRFEAWKGELEQIDDVCVIGVKI